MFFATLDQSFPKDMLITDPRIHLGAEGVRFSYAETRLWGMRDARNDGQSLRETPEPEDWRVGRRT